MEVTNQPIAFFPLAKQTDDNILAQGYKLGKVHSTITGLPARIESALNESMLIEDTVKQDVDESSMPFKKIFRSRREQLVRVSNKTQITTVLGNFKIVDELDPWREFLNKNQIHFGCSVSPTAFSSQTFYTQGDVTIYQWQTLDTSPYGWPNSRESYNVIKSITEEVDWLTGLPLIGSVNAEHTLSILDAIFFLALYVNEYKQLLTDYHSYLEKRSKETWPSTQPTLVEFNEIMNRNYVNGDWELIKRLKMEYLYANNTPNLVKSDATLLRVNGGTDLPIAEFNLPMAQDLADRIWAKISVEQGLLDVLGIGNFKSKKDLWKRNIIASWKQRMDYIARYINENRESEYGELEALRSICRYISSLHPSLRNNLLGIDIRKTTSNSRVIKIVPSSPFKILIMQTVTDEIFKKIIEQTDTFFTARDMLIRNYKIPLEIINQWIEQENRSRRSLRLNFESQLKRIIFKTLVYVNENNDEVEQYLRVKFATMYYANCVDRYNTYNENEGLRETVLAQLVVDYKGILLGGAITISQTDIDNFRMFSAFYDEEKKTNDKNLEYSFANIYNEDNEIRERVEETLAKSTVKIKQAMLYQADSQEGVDALRDVFNMETDKPDRGGANKKKPQTRKRPKKRISRKYKRQNVHRYKNRNTFRKYANQ